jgi:hypothetical protein
MHPLSGSLQTSDSELMCCAGSKQLLRSGSMQGMPCRGGLGEASTLDCSLPSSSSSSAAQATRCYAILTVAPTAHADARLILLLARCQSFWLHVYIWKYVLGRLSPRWQCIDVVHEMCIAELMWKAGCDTGPCGHHTYFACGCDVAVATFEWLLCTRLCTRLRTLTH